MDENHHAERHHEFTVDPHHHPDKHDYKIDPQMLHKYGIDMDDLREHLQSHQIEHDMHDGGEVYGHGLDQLH